MSCAETGRIGCSARGAVSTVWWPDGLLTESGHRLRYLHSFVLRSLKKIKPIKEMVLRIFCESDRSPRRAEGAGATPCGGAAVAGGGGRGRGRRPSGIPWQGGAAQRGHRGSPGKGRGDEGAGGLGRGATRRAQVSELSSGAEGVVGRGGGGDTETTRALVLQRYGANAPTLESIAGALLECRDAHSRPGEPSL